MVETDWVVTCGSRRMGSYREGKDDKKYSVPDCDLDLNYRDHCLIIVGDGEAADELLCRRRLRAGGRLAHFLFLSEDQVTYLCLYFNIFEIFSSWGLRWP